MSALAGHRFAPLWLVQWLFTWCVRCDRVATRWHYRRCPCITYEIDTPGGTVLAYLTDPSRADEAITALLDRFDQKGRDDA